MAEQILPEVYRKSPTVVANYNYTDIADGTGRISLYGFTHKETTTEKFALNTETSYSISVFSKGTTATAPYTTAEKDIDLDFDLSPFNTPRRLKGKVRINGVFGGGTRASATAGEVYIIAKVRKWDGTTETEIANAQSQTLTTTTLQVNWAVFNMEIDCPTLTNFKTGEILRITIEVWVKSVEGGEPMNGYFLHDPMNRIDAASIPDQDEGGVPLTSIFKLNVPFLLDI